MLNADPILDNSAYPHLVEHVIRFTTFNTLLAFRGTSSHFKRRVDEILHHLEIELAGPLPDGGPIRRVYVSSPVGWSCPPFNHPPERLHCGRPYTHREMVELDSARLNTIFAHTQVLDFQGPLYCDLQYTRPKSSCKLRFCGARPVRVRFGTRNAVPETLRYLRATVDKDGYSCCLAAFDAQTVVLFVGAPARNNGHSSETQLFNDTFLSRTTSKLVVNIPYCDTELLTRGFPNICHHALHELVLVFHEIDYAGHLVPQGYTPPKRASQRVHGYVLLPEPGSDRHTWAALCALFAHMTLPEVRVKITLVSVPSQLRRDGQLVSPADEFLSVINHKARDAHSRHPRLADTPFVPPMVDLLSYDEYRKRPNVDAGLETFSHRWPWDLCCALRPLG